MELSPFSNEATSRPRRDVANEKLTREIELGLLTLMLSVKVGGLVVLVVHPDNDAEEMRDDRHQSSLPPQLPRCRPNTGDKLRSPRNPMRRRASSASSPRSARLRSYSEASLSRVASEHAKDVGCIDRHLSAGPGNLVEQP